MKLLLTSAGITNESIADALSELVGKPLSQVNAGFIVTAKNNRGIPAEEAMSAQIEQLNYRGINYRLVDPSEHSNWRELLESVELVIIGGGNTFHLLNEVRKTGFDTWLEENKRSKVFMGTSAGSIVMTPDISIAAVDNGDENTPGITNMTGLCLINFELSPHTPENVSISANLEYSKSTERRILLMDNNSALSVTNEGWVIITEGCTRWCQSGQEITN